MEKSSTTGAASKENQGYPLSVSIKDIQNLAAKIEDIKKRITTTPQKTEVQIETEKLISEYRHRIGRAIRIAKETGRKLRIKEQECEQLRQELALAKSSGAETALDTDRDQPLPQSLDDGQLSAPKSDVSANDDIMKTLKLEVEAKDAMINELMAEISDRDNKIDHCVAEINKLIEEMHPDRSQQRGSSGG